MNLRCQPTLEKLKEMLGIDYENASKDGRILVFRSKKQKEKFTQKAILTVMTRLFRCIAKEVIFAE